MFSPLIDQPECWVAALGHEGLYEVSSLGRVRTVARTVVRSNGRPLSVKARIRKAFIRDRGYSTVVLARDGEQTAHLVHVLVRMSFDQHRPEDLVCRHLNGDPTDNRLENLAWGTHVDNAEDARAHGRLQTGAKNRHAKLTLADVELIRSSRLRNTELAARFKVLPMTISHARRGVTWQM